VTPNRRIKWAGPAASTININEQNAELQNDYLKKIDNLGELGVDR
jgi:hypothetical protein